MEVYVDKVMAIVYGVILCGIFEDGCNVCVYIYIPSVFIYFLG